MNKKVSSWKEGHEKGMEIVRWQVKLENRDHQRKWKTGEKVADEADNRIETIEIALLKSRFIQAGSALTECCMNKWRIPSKYLDGRMHG